MKRLIRLYEDAKVVVVVTILVVVSIVVISYMEDES